MFNGFFNLSAKFEPRDIWIGVYWDLTKSIESSYRKLEIWVCIVPMLPIKLQFEWGWKNPKYNEPSGWKIENDS